MINTIFSRPESLRDVSTHYCPGCTHGITHRLVAEVLDELDRLDLSEHADEQAQPFLEVRVLLEAGAKHDTRTRGSE